jgi:hypothetical protein
MDVRRAFSAAIGSKTPGGAGTHERYLLLKICLMQVRKKHETVFNSEILALSLDTQ